MKSSLFFGVFAAMSLHAQAAWQLDNSASTLNFISTKNAQVSETHHFKQLSGTLTDDGMLQVEVSVAQVETAIPIRNERMQKHLFEQGSVATLKAKLDSSVLKMQAGQSQRIEVDAQVTINNVTQSQSVMVTVSKDSGGNYVATTTKPFFIDANAYELSAGIDKLQELAGLKSITLSVPVTFSVTFIQQ